MIKDKIFKIICDNVKACKACKLHSTRTNVVFGEGNSNAELMFVGEGPGRDEDEQGLPFVGRAGKLLTNMIKSIGYERDQVYICNVVKCRPPNNRKPEPDEIASCIDYLKMQIHIVAPVCIVTLGATATDALLGPGMGIMKRRGQRYDFKLNDEDIRISVVPTFHPSYLLRVPTAKALAWEDFQLVKKIINDWKEFVS